MEYRQIIQRSPNFHEYGWKKESTTREEALEKAKQEESNVKTELALVHLTQFTTTEIVDVNNSFQVIATIELPNVFELNNRNGKE